LIDDLGYGWRDETEKNQDEARRLGLFSTNIPKRTKDGFKFESSNSIHKGSIDEENHGTKKCCKALSTVGRQTLLVT
jgi:hypothetical protein